MQITQEQLIESLHPHIVPEDEEYPTPKNYEQVVKLMRRFSRKTHIYFTTVAVELALPVWDQWVIERFQTAPNNAIYVNSAKTIKFESELLRRVTIGIQKYVFGETNLGKLRNLYLQQLSGLVTFVYSETSHISPPFIVLRELRDLLAMLSLTPFALTLAIHMSLEAIARADKDLREKTLDIWWQRCRAKFPVAHPEQSL